MTTDALWDALVEEAGAHADLPARARWLERVLQAASDAFADDETARAPVTDLRAALGAIVAWGRGPRTPESLVELELTMRALVARGASGLYALLARDLRELAAHGPDSASCLEAARAFQAASEAVARGEPVPAQETEALRRVRARLPTAP